MVNGKKATTSDVARLAGVSQSAVSKILNSNPDASFSPETVDRVHKAATELGYQVRARKNTNPRSSKSGSRKWVGVLCPNVTNPHYSTIVQAIEQVAYRAGYQIFVCNTYRDVALEERYLSQLVEMGVAGIIYAFLPNATRKASEVASVVPMVVIGDKTADDISIDILELDSLKSGALVANHLLELGHKNFAFISTTLNQYNPARTRRLQGVIDTLEQNGLGDRLVVLSNEISMLSELDYMSTEYTTGYNLAKSIVKDHNVTALIGVNDMVAYGILDAISDLGLRVPEDFSVCGFDNNFPSAFKQTSLTTVDHHIVYKGNNAFDILLKKILHNGTDLVGSQFSSTIKVEYVPNLIVRGSTAPPKGAPQ